jgi:hypothetical protein
MSVVVRRCMTEKPPVRIHYHSPKSQQLGPTLNQVRQANIQFRNTFNIICHLYIGVEYDLHLSWFRTLAKGKIVRINILTPVNKPKHDNIWNLNGMTIQKKTQLSTNTLLHIKSIVYSYIIDRHCAVWCNIPSNKFTFSDSLLTTMSYFTWT